jgi:iron complex outermembrane receptor protein
MLKIFIISFIFILSTFSISQSSIIKGTIVDDADNPIIGANVFLVGTVLGDASDEKGQFYISNIPHGKFNLSITVIGFEEKTIHVETKIDESYDLEKIVLKSMPLNTQPIVVTASKYKQKIQNVPVSINTINRMELENRNSITIDEALKYVPGINMNRDQVNIRGSNGFSQGVGSRVMMLIDGVPYITGDTQGLVFEAIAVNQVENIEIVKGAGSALYGSSAIGGVINIITKSISDKTEFGFKLYGGLYSDPYYDQWKWTDKTQFLYGTKVSYSTKMDKMGIRFAAAQDKDDSYRRNGWKERYNFGGKLEFEFSPFEKLTISGNYMDQKRGNFLYWKDLQHALEPTSSQLDESIHSSRFYISPIFRKVNSPTNFYNIKAIWFHNNFDDNIDGDIDGGNQSTADNFYIDFQYNILLKNHFLTFGASPSINTVSSDIFGSRDGYGAATYIQDEIKWNDIWNTTIGGRIDYYDIDSVGTDYRINPKFGVVYKPSLTTIIRTSIGTGFRAPSMAEAFTNTNVSGIPVVSNTNLKSEKSISWEIGLNQILSTNMVTDVAIFYNQYKDLIEGFVKRDSLERAEYIKFKNIHDARIIGFDSKISGQILNNSVMYNIGYTYLDAQDLSINDFLKYRPRHLFYTGTVFNIHDFQVGMDYRFIKRYDRIDNELAAYIDDAEVRGDAHIVDVRIIKQLKIGSLPLKISLQINNFLQYNYIDLIGSIAPIRNFIFTLETSL